jgi:hypothetical protein
MANENGANGSIRIYCKAKECREPYEADVAPDHAITELIAGLNEDEYLPGLAAGERWRVVHARTEEDLPPSAQLHDREVKDGDQLDFLRDSHGAEGSA